MVVGSIEQKRKEIKKISNRKKHKIRDESCKSRENKLIVSIIRGDKKTIEDGRIINDAINRGIMSFTPELIFEQLVERYSIAKNIYGPSIIRILTNYDEEYVRRNINIPEFKVKIKENIESNIERLKDRGLIEKDGKITKEGIKLASLILYMEELNNLVPRGILGEKLHKRMFVYGDKKNTKEYKRGDLYKDIDIRKSIRLAIRRNHHEIKETDLRAFEKEGRGQIYVIYGLDASGSMKGKKIETCKKAGIALAYKAIEKKDKVGLIVFGSEIKQTVEPTGDFRKIIYEIAKVRASKKTNIALTIKKAIELFPNKEVTKHLILLTDALPTEGKEPDKETLEASSIAKSKGITISVVGIKLDSKGENLAKKIVSLGDGRLYIVKDIKNIDKIILEDYYSLQNKL